MSTELADVSKAVAEFDRVAGGLAELRQKYQGVVYDVSTTAGMVDAKAARVAIREPRYEVERIRKSAKAPLLALGKRLDSEAARITSELEKLEAPIHQQISTEETRKEAERQAKVEAELKRVADLQDRIAELRGNQNLTASSGSKLIAEHLADLEAIPVDESFEEMQQQAADAKGAGLKRLQDLHAAALAHEAEQARITAEREELARLRAEEQRRQAEERARIAEEERVAKTARAKEERKAREAREAEEGRLRKEREEEARQQEEERRIYQVRMSEITGIQQQAIIAQMGRAGVRKGGTLECIQETLAETEAWPIEESNFGPLTGVAQNAKDSAIAAIRESLAAFERRQADEAERNRLAAERAELERQQRELKEAEEHREAEAAAQREREAAAARAQAAKEARRQEMAERDRPSALALCEAVSDWFEVDIDIAAQWIAETPHEEWAALAVTEVA